MSERKILNNEQILELSRRDESEFLSLILRDKDLFEKTVTFSPINTDFFLHKEHAQIFHVSAKYYGKYAALINRDTFQKMLEESGQSELEIGRWRKAFDAIASRKINNENFEKLKDNLEARYLQQAFFEKIVDSGLVQGITHATSGQKDLVFKFQEEVNALSIEENSNAYRSTTFSETLGDVFDVINKRRENPEAEKGILTGYSAIDDKLFGFQHGKYVVIAGFPNGGKTTMMLNLALNMALKGSNVLYVTIEMTDEEVCERLLSIKSGVPSRLLRRGGKDKEGINEEVYQRLMAHKMELDSVIGETFTFVTVPQKTPLDKIIALIDRKRKFMKLDAIFVDYLDIVGSVAKYNNRPDLELADVSVRLQAYGKMNNILMVTANSIKSDKIGQFRKKGVIEDEELEKNAINVEDLGGTQKISRDCDYMLSVVFNQFKDRLYIWWSKARFLIAAGETFTLNADPACGRLSDSDYDEVDKDGVRDFLQNDEEDSYNDLFDGSSKDNKVELKEPSNPVEPPNPEKPEEKPVPTITSEAEAEVEKKDDPKDTSYLDWMSEEGFE
jgi:replicative DNA helicase